MIFLEDANLHFFSKKSFVIFRIFLIFVKKFMLDKLLIKHFIDYLRLEQSMSDNSIVAYAHDIEMFYYFLNGAKRSTSLKDIQQEDIEDRKSVV